VETVTGPWEAAWGGSLYSPVPGTSLVSHHFIEQNFFTEYEFAAFGGHVFDLHLVRAKPEVDEAGRPQWRWLTALSAVTVADPEDGDEDEEPVGEQDEAEQVEEETVAQRHARFRALEATAGAQIDTQVRPLAVSPV